jgi:hypothetical protein
MEDMTKFNKPKSFKQASDSAITKEAKNTQTLTIYQ